VSSPRVCRHGRIHTLGRIGEVGRRRADGANFCGGEEARGRVVRVRTVPTFGGEGGARTRSPCPDERGETQTGSKRCTIMVSFSRLFFFNMIRVDSCVLFRADA
jgi:hypothetical protein